jgi:hypothetical protein
MIKEQREYGAVQFEVTIFYMLLSSNCLQCVSQLTADPEWLVFINVALSFCHIFSALVSFEVLLHQLSLNTAEITSVRFFNNDIMTLFLTTV